MLRTQLWPTDFDLHMRIPEGGTDCSSVLVTVHGISRNAPAHLAAFASANPGIAVLAPQFGEHSFPHFQRLGLGHAELRSDLMLDAALERAARVTTIDTRRFHLFGFSGGAQFALRYAMLNPGRVRSLHLGAAGWYMFPDAAIPWPRGCGSELGRQFIVRLEQFLALPIHIYVGADDTLRDPSLRTGTRIDRQQGPHRLARAECYFEHLKRVAGRTFLEVLPACGHDFDEACCEPADLPGRVLRNLEWNERQIGPYASSTMPRANCRMRPLPTR